MNSRSSFVVNTPFTTLRLVSCDKPAEPGHRAVVVDNETNDAAFPVYTSRGSSSPETVNRTRSDVRPSITAQQICTTITDSIPLIAQLTPAALILIEIARKKIPRPPITIPRIPDPLPVQRPYEGPLIRSPPPHLPPVHYTPPAVLLKRFIKGLALKLPEIKDLSPSSSFVLYVVDASLVFYTLWRAFHYKPPAPNGPPGPNDPPGPDGPPGPNGPHGPDGPPGPNDHTAGTQSVKEPYQLVGKTVVDPLDEYKKTVASIIEEYFSTDDVGQAASDLRELSSSQYPHFIKLLVSMAMDRHDKEKEMASVLLSALYADVISSAQIQDGFYILLDSADDLAVDILDAADILALFLARAVVDDILPPAFLTRAKKALSESSKGVQVIQTAEKSYLSASHHAELVERRWGGSTHVTVEEVKKKISDLLREYVESGDTLEACRCIRELGVPFYHHEVVKRALILGMETQTAEPLITKLLKEAAEEGIICSSQMAKGFSHLADSLDDLALDIPSAKTLFQSLVPKAIFEGWLDDSFVESLSADGEVQVGDEKVRQYEKEIVSIIHEYFLSDDIPELIESFEDLAAPEYYPIFLKKLITLAMDGKNREKEMASVLLSALHTEIFSAEDKVNGFVLLLESAEDTELDNLDASNELALFLARAVIDDVLAPLNLEEIGSRLRPNCSATETVRMAQSLVSARHAGERLLGGSH